MLDRLEESFVRMRRFTADAAHEFRTPLTGLRTTAELALRRNREPEEYREALTQVITISDRMNHLSENLLALARGDDRAAPRSTGTVDLAGLIRGVVAEMEPLFLEKQLTVELALESRPILPAADADGIRRLIAALIDNARKYTPAGGGVRVSLHDDATEAVLEVSDTGYGIPDEALTRIFDRFYRIDPSRDRETGGHGLGLAIAQQIARFHHGQVEASNVPGSGATFRFRVPKNGAEH
jgi:signal transduction histidine kinase